MGKLDCPATLGQWFCKPCCVSVWLYECVHLTVPVCVSISVCVCLTEGLCACVCVCVCVCMSVIVVVMVLTVVNSVWVFQAAQLVKACVHRPRSVARNRQSQRLPVRRHADHPFLAPEEEATRGDGVSSVSSQSACSPAKTLYPNPLPYTQKQDMHGITLDLE